MPHNYSGIMRAHVPLICAYVLAARLLAGPAPQSAPVTQQQRQTIDSACQGVLGLACSTTSGDYASVYAAITQSVAQRRLGSDWSSITYNYLIPLLRKTPAWQTRVVGNAWRAAACPGTAAGAYWTGRYGEWQTFQQLFNMIRESGCATRAPILSKKK